MPKYLTLSLIAMLSLTVSCRSAQKQPTSIVTTDQIIPVFSGDSAWIYTNAQTLFGPRTPNSKAHEQCRHYLVQTLSRLGAKVIEQKADLKGYDGKILHSTNIIASFYPAKASRVLLCAHWDSRPWADQDPDPKNHHTPILGANDGASGVGVLVEIARILGDTTHQPNAGIDIVLFDAEDYGTPEWYEGEHDEDSWCLGTQYWAKHPHTPNYKAKYGILLDMVGGKSPSFYWDYFSLLYAPDVCRKVWSVASGLGYNNQFIARQGGAITDDHLFINRLANIPCIDIIDLDPSRTSPFVETWHTLDDTMDNIDAQTLKMVGETLTNVIFSE